MTPLVLYLQPLQLNLEVGYNDFKTEVSLYVGYGADGVNWTAAQSAELNRDVQEAYRWVLYPQTIPSEKIPHTWSFLIQTTTLTTEADTYNYQLPLDFGSFIGHFFYWPVNEGYLKPSRTSDGDILNLRQYHDTDGKPHKFAIRWKARANSSRQRQEVLFWPTPDDEYTLTYRYAVLTNALSTTNPYPLGGPRIGQLVMEACRAIGEHKKNGVRGDQWELFIEQMQSAILLDKGTLGNRTVGVMCDPDGYGYMKQTQRTPSYYFGPAADGTYTLETA